MTAYQANSLHKLLSTRLFDIDLNDNEVWRTDTRGDETDLYRIVLKIIMVNGGN